MMGSLGAFLKVISTEDPENEVYDPVRVGAVAGLAVYIFGGLALIATAFHTAWFLKTAPDFAGLGTGLAAWGVGLGGALAGIGGALLGKAHADAITDAK